MGTVAGLRYIENPCENNNITATAMTRILRTARWDYGIRITVMPPLQNRKLNEEFERKRRIGEASGLTASALGIVKKKQVR